ncbi:MAG: N-acetyl-gamma-glutamyl-phosphate reductase [Candidatus Omnitrophica bacterium]|nr:N-acetyl-gamma-glutamyl-phosphate reductase [Candidatus Omnitrophota bacterium]MDD5436486.1 N-acetyl-gamma-glutamyl-phosphate reductase [Candidatus Omnitrophota bacterium]
MIKVGVVGATGYAGEEVIKILVNHKGVKITELQAVIDKEELFSSIFPVFKGKVDIVCKKPDPDAMAKNVDLVFLGLPHKVSMDLAPIFLKHGKLVIDLSADYRLAPDVYKVWYGIEHKDKANLPGAVYGLPELYYDAIKKAKLIANPGCYPTSAILGIAPMLSHKAINANYIIVDSKSGVTGAGRKPDLALSFSEVNENLKAYKVNEHQHKPEINKILSEVAKQPIDIVFTPHLIPMNRGILSTIYLKLTKKLDTKAVIDIYKDFYKGKPFVRISDEGKLPQIRDIVGTNYCDIGIKVSGDTLIVVSCIDNLKKGAAGQAVQNMNIMCDFAETEGLI